MKQAVIAALLAIGVVYAWQQSADEAPVAVPDAQPSQNTELERAFRERRTNYQVSGTGEVSRILADDNDGSRHQRFIVRLQSGRTVLIAHNIDLAPRVSSLRVGDTVSFFGEYEWNDRGGVIHWTHHDPRGQHVSGWIEHDNRKYQ